MGIGAERVHQLAAAALQPIGEPGRRPAWAELRLLKRHHDKALPDVVGKPSTFKK